MPLDKEKDPRAKALENNPCSMCRALGLPVCKGHGGGSGGGGETSGATDDTETKPLDIHDALSKSDSWHAEPNADEVYIYNASHSALSIKLDLKAMALS
jgi:hypothetical protein